MPEVFIDDYMQKLLLLEGLAGAKTTYHVQSPLQLDPRDTIQIQKAARQLGQLIGLQKLTFNVAVAKQPEAVGGHIRLRRDDPVVFIAIECFADRLTRVRGSP